MIRRYVAFLWSEHVWKAQLFVKYLSIPETVWYLIKIRLKIVWIENCSFDVIRITPNFSLCLFSKLQIVVKKMIFVTKLIFFVMKFSNENWINERKMKNVHFYWENRLKPSSKCDQYACFNDSNIWTRPPKLKPCLCSCECHIAVCLGKRQTLVLPALCSRSQCTKRDR